MKPTRFPAWLLSGLLTLAAASCQKETPTPTQQLIRCGTGSNMVQVSYAQTYCADPWGQAQGTQQLETVAATYLAQHNLTTPQLHASVKYPAAVCNACACTTGLVLEGYVSAADLPAVLALGFTQPVQ